jgi:hypothetical protein
LIAGLVIDGAGEMVGYSFGGGDAVERSSGLEFHRERHLAGADTSAANAAAAPAMPQRDTDGYPEPSRIGLRHGNPGSEGTSSGGRSTASP